jgi:tetratricopeptide (TPR) repeat protein
MRSAVTFALLCFFVFLSSYLPAQIRVEESYVNLQKVLIDANREKLLGNFDKALAMLESLRKENREVDVILYEMARVHAEKGELEKGVDLLRDAIRLNADNSWYDETLAFYLERLGRLAEAADQYGVLRLKFPREKRYYFTQAGLLQASGDIEGAIKVYDAWEKVAGMQTETFLRKYELYAAAGESKKAVRELESLIRLSPSNLSHRHLLAAYLLDIKDEKGAIQVFTDILGIDPNDPKAQLALAASKPVNSGSGTSGGLTDLMPLFEKTDISIDAKLARIIPRIEEVAQTEDQSLADQLLQLTAILERVHPKDAKAFAASGDLFFLTGQLGAARDRYETTLSLDDRNFMVWENLFYVLEASADWPALLQQTELAMDIFPNRGTVFLLNGVAAFETGAYEDALSVLNQAALMFSFDKPQLLRTLLVKGKTFYRQGAYEDAMGALEAAMQNGGDTNAMVVEQMGDLMYRMDRPDEALDYWQKAQKLGKGASKWLSKKIADKKLYE